MGTKLLAAIVLTKNEEENLGRCLTSLLAVDADVFVVDSGSTDRTMEIANRFGAKTAFHAWRNYSDQMNWATDHLETDAPWILRLDADEYLTPELAAELLITLPKMPPECTGLLVKRRFMFLGRWMKHGGMFPLWHLRMWRAGMARCEERWMDEHMQLASGELRKLNHDFVDDNQKDLTFWIEKHNQYASREVLDLVSVKQPGSHVALEGQAARKRWFKESLYSRAPLLARSAIYWLYRYVALAGFLDGKEGAIFHFLHAFWYRFLVDSKMIEWHMHERHVVKNLEEHLAENKRVHHAENAPAKIQKRHNGVT
jgi:glycosyltransferase involved in cell wall biosynthesis